MTDTELLDLAALAVANGAMEISGDSRDAEANRRMITKMLNDPAEYYAAAPLEPALRIYAELRERVAKQSCGAALPAVKRIIRRNRNRAAMRGVWKSEDGTAWCCCDGAMEARLKKISGVPVLENGFPHLEAQIDDCAKKADKSLPLPSAGELKAYIAAEKAAGIKPDFIWYWWGGDTPAVNAAYLLDMVTLFPDCKEALYWTEISPLYFRGENGDGIVLPVRRGNHPKFEVRWNEMHKSAG